VLGLREVNLFYHFKGKKRKKPNKRSEKALYTLSTVHMHKNKRIKELKNVWLKGKM
jgi:hypothetical protein